MTARRIRALISQIQMVVGMVSVLVARSVPELSKERMLVPVFGSLLLAGLVPVVGGQMAWVAGLNSRSFEGRMCSCQTWGRS